MSLRGAKRRSNPSRFIAASGLYEIAAQRLRVAHNDNISMTKRAFPCHCEEAQPTKQSRLLPWPLPGYGIAAHRLHGARNDNISMTKRAFPHVIARRHSRRSNLGRFRGRFRVMGLPRYTLLRL